MSRPIRRLLSAFLIAFLAPTLGAEPVSLEQAKKDLAMLDDLLDSRGARHDDIAAWMLVAAENYSAVEGEERKVAGFRKDVIDQLLDALRKTRIKDDSDVRAPVSIKAAETLAALGPKLDDKTKTRLWNKVRRVIVRMQDAKRYTPSVPHIEAMFNCLPHVGTLETLRWILEDYTHSKKNEVEYLVAAHKAMHQFKNVPGKQRYEIVDRFIDRYAGVEALAVQRSADPAIVSKKVFWDNIRVNTIATVQYFAGFPKDEAGAAINTMKGFQIWFRGVKNPRKAPWLDPKNAN